MKLHSKSVFVTMVRSKDELPQLTLLIKSIRAWAGELARVPIVIFNVNPVQVSCKNLEDDITESVLLDVPEHLRRYYYGDKVYACSRAEELFPEVDSLIWIDPGCLVINPPLGYILSKKEDCSVRPVHIQNVGLLTGEPLDVFWKEIFKTLGLKDIARSVETFIGKKTIRAYYNSHAFSVSPSTELLRKWLVHFNQLMQDDSYQKNACEDEWHKIFLHQAVLSGLIAGQCEKKRVKLLPPKYNYPYNLQNKVPVERRETLLNNLLTVAYENRSLDPDKLEDIRVNDPLKTWLQNNI